MRWAEAIRTTVALWLFVALIFLPIILRRQEGAGISSILLDNSTFLFSMALGLCLFALFRTTIDWPNRSRALVLLGAVGLFAIVNSVFDLLFTGFVAANLEQSWAALPRDLTRGYESAFRYLLVFSVNLALFQLAFSMRRSLATEKLSSFLRSSLSCDPAELVPLAEELALIEEYLDIEAVRFGERLNVSVDCKADACDVLVPGFLVQPLVENAIKHGVAQSRDPVEIVIQARLTDGLLRITVENDVVPEVTRRPGWRSGVGLVNVKQRLQAVYGPGASLNIETRADRFCATISIPEPGAVQAKSKARNG